MHSDSAERRLRPRIFDTDWLVLREMHSTIDSLAGAVVRSGATAIDFGCGSQPYRRLFEAKGAIYRGADLQGGELPIERGRVGAPDGEADLVLSFQVLEHVADVGAYLQEARRLLKDDGRLLLSTHGSWLYHPHPEDHRRWTRQGLLAEIAACGFETIDCIPVLGPLAWTTLLRLTLAYHGLRRVPMIGAPMARALAIVMNVRGYLENFITPAWVTTDNACVYVILARPASARP
jgi:SAM-dependent methyltransferase